MRPLYLCFLAAVALAKPPKQMTLAFSEDFDGPDIDPAKWTEAARSPAGTVSIKDGKLVLGIAKCPDNIWRGGAINTRGHFSQGLGYFEASIQAGEHQGHHLGFILPPHDKKELYAEIYVVEAFGDDRIVTWVRYNDGTALRDEKPSPEIKPFKGGAAHKDFHVYGVLWEEKELTWYIDGRKVFATKKVTNKDPACISLGHTVSEYEIPRLDPSKVPDDVRFDWVKVWK